ncbi:MAG TPA: D-2-hydroxyacid dehydrogenase family protein [Steroidobacteraceae bacterium]|jgi:phosphoglycerate dehydrogenase-like enzyme|nr:D-2-hydroxyacid dehydrogenase family protein [Steroidobacteraceae bacterium]
MQVKIAVLDDYQGVALEMADWSAVSRRAQLDVFNDHLADPEAVVRRLLPYDVVCVMRERTPLRRETIERLPNLKLIASTGPRNASIDPGAAAARGIKVVHTGYFGSPTVELTWALILAGTRHIVAEAAAVRSGAWQHTIGDDLSGKTLGVIGLGNLGAKVAKIGAAFGMEVIAWSQNLTAEKTAAVGAVELVSKEQLLRRSDIVSIHLVLSERTRGLIGPAELALMKPGARLVNTSRGPIVAEGALLAALHARQIAGAAIDVYDTEPLPADHPYRSAAHLLATPHIGYVSRGLYERFYRDTVANVLAWMDARG